MFVTLFVLAIVVLDQITKYLAVLHLKGEAPVDFLFGLFRFTYHENRGAAWGILSDARWVFMSASVIAIVFLTFFLIRTRKNRPLLLSVAIPMFLGGGIGNMIDRIRLGYVVDFIEFGHISFPVFNVADSFVSIGAVVLVCYLIADIVKERKQKKEETPK